MTVETLLVTILAVLPGYVGLLTLRFLSAEDDGETWETIARSLIIGILSALPLLVVASFGWLQGYWRYILGPREPSIDVLWGFLLHTASAVALSAGLAKALTSRWTQRLGRSVFHSGWDWTWFRTAKDRRHVLVQTTSGTYYGPLAFAGTLRKGGGVVIRNPRVLIEGRLRDTGTEYLLVNEPQIRHIQVTRHKPSAGLTKEEDE